MHWLNNENLSNNQYLNNENIPSNGHIEDKKSDRFGMDLKADHTAITNLLNARIGSEKITADLVDAIKINEPKFYKRFTGIKEKELYRQELVNTLEATWTEKIGPEKAAKYKELFMELATNLNNNGAVVLGAILSTENFEKLIQSYTTILRDSGSKSWIHSFVNLANHPDFLTDKNFNQAFMHPLLIALVSHRIGGPVRIVDARGKDAEPISVLAQDNMLHIDNTPFNDEYKIILAWERGRPSGPKGQNFVFLPGTQKGVRQSITGQEGPWSSENASIFTTRESVKKLLDFQKKQIGKHAVVELSHPTKPLTTLFAAGSLVHHRHRTESGLARSCMIIAFHRAEDNPGQLVSHSALEKTAEKADPLAQALIKNSNGLTKKDFITTLTQQSDEMMNLMDRLVNLEEAAEVINPEARELKTEEIEKWIETSTEAPTVLAKKLEANVVPIGQDLNREEFVENLGKMMAFDKHGPLDLILYADSHEEIRKWARNQIREKNITKLNDELAENWAQLIKTPDEADLRTPLELQDMAYALAAIAKEKMSNLNFTPLLNQAEKISPSDAIRSTHQLLLDLGESIVRCEDASAFLSTSLFIFWAADTLMRLDPDQDENVKKIGESLLHNYVATAVLLEKDLRKT